MYAAKNRTERRAYDRKRGYGISQEIYDQMLANQAGFCAVCGKAETAKRNGKVRALCVDHDHVTGQVRGLLCSACNISLGGFKDDFEVLYAAAQYLHKFKEVL